MSHGGDDVSVFTHADKNRKGWLRRGSAIRFLIKTSIEFQILGHFVPWFLHGALP